MASTLKPFHHGLSSYSSREGTNSALVCFSRSKRLFVLFSLYKQDNQIAFSQCPILPSPLFNLERNCQHTQFGYYIFPNAAFTGRIVRNELTNRQYTFHPCSLNGFVKGCEFRHSLVPTMKLFRRCNVSQLTVNSITEFTDREG